MIYKKNYFKGIIKKTALLQYIIYLPESYKKNNNKWPLLLFLHGMGERGNNIKLVNTHGPAKLALEGREFPFILIAPQCPKNSLWTMELDSLKILILKIINRYNFDTERIYLTGLSMGGYGCWHLAESMPQAFAAIVPICGTTMPDTGFPDRLKILKDVPIWAFHGAEDDIVPVKEMHDIFKVLKRAGSKARLTVYKKTGHDSWFITYNNPELYKWLLKQKNKKFKI